MMRQSLIDYLRQSTNLGLGQGFTIPMPDEVVDVLVEWLRENAEELPRIYEADLLADLLEDK